MWRRRAARRKHKAELAYWKERRDAEGVLGNAHYEMLFTDLFGLEVAFYRGKRLLDVGCGPRGSLVWAREAGRRVGLDPLADEYRALGTEEHGMEYVSGRAEEMPFEDGAFDVVSSLNSLDHVDDLAQAVAEIKRVTAPGGPFLLAVEVGHAPTDTEPHSLSWELAERFEPEFEVVERGEYARDDGWMFDSALRRERFDHSASTQRSGVLVGVMRKQSAT